MRTPAERYEPQEIETRWQRLWEEKQVFAADKKPNATPESPKDYVLEMFPYPSGALHMGHVRVYSIGDVLARLSRMKGNAVLHPMGYDSLGLPAENAAIRDGIHPRIRTAKNIESFRKEMGRMGFSFDWSRELATSDPSYYRWNQWFFLRMLERDLVYRRNGFVNWCPECQTVLANEQVDNGVCWRGHTGVTQKLIGEWAFRITKYADQLLDGLKELSAWPDRIVSMQRNWIGRSEGAEIAFPVVGKDFPVKVFTTRVDTIYGCSYLVIAPEHPLTEKLVSEGQRAKVEEFAERMLRSDRLTRTSTTAEKEGVDTGAFATNPYTGEKVPIWVANFVVADYGTGAVMSVPAHDARDFAFAKKYQLPIKVVIRPAKGDQVAGLEEAFTEDGVVEVGGAASGLSSADARRKLTDEAAAKGFGKARVTYQLRDWGFSRQRYWGTPIPVIYCPHEGTADAPKIIPVPDRDLPVVLPEKVELTGKGAPPLARVAEFIEVKCPSCGKPARRESDTMDTFVDSSWYFGRFLDPKNEIAPFDAAKAKRWLPIDTYVGGPEHAVLHLLYFRFWTRVMNELGLCAVKEPARRLITQGIVLGADGEKMSKSVGNVVSPGPYLDKYGADTLRLFVLFAGPVDHDYAFSDAQVDGQFRFLARIWRFFARFHGEVVNARAPAGEPSTPRAKALRQLSHRTLKRVTEDLERVHFNTCIAALMEQLNGLQAAMGSEEKLLPLAAGAEGDGERSALREALEVQAVCLSPFAPHLAEELWSLLGHAEMLQESRWPAWDPALVVAENVIYAVQVNGKLRGEVEIAASAAEAEVVAAAKASDKVQAHLAGKTLRKTVFVPKRLVNFVAN